MAENRLLGKASVVVRLIVVAAVGGALVAGIALPAVGALGTIVRDGATKFNTLDTPELHQLPVRSAILDRHGKVLAYYYPRGIDRVPVDYSQISPDMRQAIVAIEDSRFYQHGAIDFRGTIRASTTFRRCNVAETSAFVPSGLYRLGFSTMPASMAACPSVSLAAEMLK